MPRAFLQWIVLPLGVLVAGLALAIHLVAEGVGGTLHGRGAIAPHRVPEPEVAERLARQRRAEAALGGVPAEQILFGDLHVHTTWSGDAFVFSLPLMQGEGAHPPADACDFARHCAALDFWSLNDHAEYLTPRQWRETVQAIRECNAQAGATESPDLVGFVGWEWTQSAPAGSPDERVHYGHKNVYFLGTADDELPTRPIGAGAGGLFGRSAPPGLWPLVRFAIALPDWRNLDPYLDFNAFTREFRSHPTCAAGVPVRELPNDCIEGADTPEALFAKLDDWDLPSLVIPHGTSWGIHAPPRASLADQLGGRSHDPDRQRLFEVYSGHGSSERWRPLRDFVVQPDGARRCAPPADGYLPCCWRAGELVRERCDDATSAEVCDARVERARRLALEAPTPYGVVAGTTADDWLECGQLPDGFLPAYEYRPAMSAQYGLALRSEDGASYRYGLIGSSDNHKARAGAGYKELARKAFGDAYGPRRDWYDALWPDPAEALAPAAALPVDEAGPLAGLAVGFERGASFYYTGGLVAVHARGRDRRAVWDALVARRAYGTSGPRILLWFELLNAPGGPRPMGSELSLDTVPRFRVRAAGGFEQRPGCPESSRRALGPERLQRLCLGECHHPGETRHPIERIEVVRIRVQRHPGEPVAPLIEDPWRVLECPAEGDGCSVEFAGAPPEPDRDVVYYVRALQAPTPAVNGDPMRCERDGEGRCVAARSCPAAGPRFDPADDCLAPVRERAWSSPIFLRAAPSRPGAPQAAQPGEEP